MDELELPRLKRRAPKPAPVPRPPEDLVPQASRAVAQAADFLFSFQREESHWCAELESNCTITAEYVLMCQMLGLRQSLLEDREKLSRHLFHQQRGDGSWTIAYGCDGDVSTTAEAYLALRILDYPENHPDLLRAERFIRANGGLEKARIFTRIFLAMFGLLSWDSLPAIPPELILLPPRVPINIYAFSSWARGTMIPLFIIFHHRPVFALPDGGPAPRPAHEWLDHLWLDTANKNQPCSFPWFRAFLKQGASYKTLFAAVDQLLRFYEKFRIGSVRTLALDQCTEWILERQENSGDWAGIFPPMLNNVIALFLQGFPNDSPPVRKGVEAIRRFSWEDDHGLRIQACVSHVWDTVLATIGLLDCGVAPTDPRLSKAMRWVRERQLLVEHGDWRIYRPNLKPGGWSFEYYNSWYPDVDDTAAALLAALKHDPASADSDLVERAVNWMIGMQNRDGGFAAFDVDNDKLFLNEIPFSDMNSLCDPSSPDVTGRVLEALGLLLRISDGPEPRVAQACSRAVEYLRKAQEPEGCWYGRWGVNYIYGTSNVLCGLAPLQVQAANLANLRMIDRGLRWLKQAQNPDGGWGESVASYADRKWMGRGDSTPSQTAWALMGLLAFLPAEDPAIHRGIAWLIDHQISAGSSSSASGAASESGRPVPSPRGATWREEHFTGTGFPNHFYLRYHLYRHYFPMMALGRYLAKAEN